MKPGHTAGLVHTDNQANTQANFTQTPSQACIILKARGEKNNAIQVINPIYFTVCSQRKDLGLEAFCVCALYLCVYRCVCIHSCLLVRARRLHARINKETALVAYSQPWSTAREIILCSGISARELTVHHLDFAVYLRKGCIAWSRRSCSFLQCLL